MKLLLLAIFVALAFCDPKKPPLFPEQFSAEFEESSQLIVIGITEGHYYYDSVNQRQAIYRYNGRYDRYCGNVYKNQETPCRHVVVNGTNRFIQESDIWTSPKEITVASAVIAAMDVECSKEISSFQPMLSMKVNMKLMKTDLTTNGSSMVLNKMTTSLRVTFPEDFQKSPSTTSTLPVCLWENPMPKISNYLAIATKNAVL